MIKKREMIEFMQKGKELREKVENGEAVIAVVGNEDGTHVMIAGVLDIVLPAITYILESVSDQNGNKVYTFEELISFLIEIHNHNSYTAKNGKENHILS